uniref:Uncharacterized protein n=1 Tax=Scleropages formosus TaxID=113540 RepID=A0A8C9RZG1_SCLFO
MWQFNGSAMNILELNLFRWIPCISQALVTTKLQLLLPHNQPPPQIALSIMLAQGSRSAEAEAEWRTGDTGRGKSTALPLQKTETTEADLHPY